MIDKSKNKKILFLSNGYGEDTIAVSIIENLLKISPNIEILALPLVGDGVIYKKRGIKIVGPLINMPSQGMIPASFFNIFKDIKKGLISLTIGQIKAIIKEKKNVDILVAVGDSFPVLLGGFFGKSKLIYIGTAKTNYFYPYSSLEKGIYRKFCNIVFTRDEPTSESLVLGGVNAKWVGNCMMDNLEITNAFADLASDKTVIGILPGSRDYIYKDFEVILNAVSILAAEQKKSFLFLVAIAETIDINNLLKLKGMDQWTFKESLFKSPNILGVLVNKDQVEVLLARGVFADIISLSNIVIGLAGTGNEQAVGFGKPVVAFDGTSDKKLGWYRGRQKGLLGDAISIVKREPDAISKEVNAILNDTKRYEYMASVGQSRMGPPGASTKIAEYIIKNVV